MTDVIRQISSAIQRADNLGEALDLLVSRICPLLEVDACTVFIYDSDDDHYVMMASSIQNYALILGHWNIKKGEGLISQVVEQGAPLAIEDTTDNPNNVEIADGMQVTPFKAFLGIPLQYQSKTLGIIAIQHRERRKFNDSEIASLSTLSSQLADTIADAIETGRMSDALSSYHSDKRTLQLFGIAAASGVTMGEIVVIYPHANLTSVEEKLSEDIDEDINLFDQALSAVVQDISKMDEILVRVIPNEERALFNAYLQILKSNSFRDDVIQRIRSGQWVQAALRDSIRALIKKFDQMPDEYLRERGEDIADLGRRLLAKLQESKHLIKKFPQKIVLVGSDITVSMLAEVPHNRLKAIISINGSTNSHMVIFAKALGIPAIVGAKHLPLKVLTGQNIIVDGYTGHLFINPDDMLKLAYQRLIHEEEELQEHLLILKPERAITTDGVVIPLRANIGLIADLNPALDMQAEGIGLYRTEVPFMVLDRFPSEDEQRILYRQLLASFPNHPVVMRTLDIGGDKELSYFNIKENNPFLGWRGIRLLLDHPDIFKTQIRAMLRASEGFNNLHILLPMVSVVEEIDTALRFIGQEYHKLKDQGLNIHFPKVGAMVEVPAAVYQISDIVSLSDFVSVGSNDLTQYILAVDRTNVHVAKLYDNFHPAVMRALFHIVDAAKRASKPVSLCGELASDPIATLALIGMGFDSLSMNTNSLLKIKWLLRGFTQSHCRTVLMDIINMRTGNEIRSLLQETIIEAGFGGLIRAGKY